MSRAVRLVPLVAAALLAGRTAHLAGFEPPVPVRFAEGAGHVALVLRSQAGTELATGDSTQTVTGDKVTTRVVFHFKDGSVHDETAVFTQHGVFLLVSDRLVQTGKTFPTPLDVTIDRARGEIVTKYQERGVDKIDTQRLTLPDDLANGLIPTLLKNVPRDTGPLTLSLLAATPKPRLVKLNVTVAGAESIPAGPSLAATHFVLKVDIGGLSGLLAPMVGKQPPDSHVWISQGAVPALVQLDAELYVGAPLWHIELAKPAIPGN
jgi:hypothetical protein